MKSRRKPHRGPCIERLEPRLVLAASELLNDADTLLLLHMNGDLNGAAGETPTVQVGVTFPNGMLNQGAHVDSTGRIRYATSANIQASEGTIEFWVKPDWNGNTATNHTFLEVGDNFNNGMILSMDAANNLRCLQWGDDPSTPAVEINVERGIGKSAATWVAGDWHHIAATWRGSTREMTFYVDGQSVGSLSNGVQIANFSTSYLSIGAEVGNQNPAAATFDEFRISSRARSAGEITADYNRALGLGSLGVPAGIAVNAANQVYVVESSLNHVTVFDASGTAINQFGSVGSGAGQFSQPWGIGIASSGDVFVVDRGNHRVERFSNTGVFLSQFGSSGTAAGQFNSPQGIFVDSTSGRIYVADSANHRVERFLMDGTLDAAWATGGVLGATGVVKRDHTGFDRPSAVAIHPVTGDLYVADYGNARIEVFNASGAYARTYNAVYRPNGLAFDTAGNLYIAGEDPNTNYPPYDGRLRLLRAGESLISENYTGGLDDLGRVLYGVALRPDGHLLIADSLNSRIVQTDSGLTEPVHDLTIEAHGDTAMFRWKTAQASASTVRYGTTSSYGSQVTDATLTTDHVVVVNGLTPNTRLYYGVSYSDSFDGTARFTAQDVMNTGALPGQTQFQRIKAIGVIYTDTLAGTGYAAMNAATLAAAHARYARLADFYWRNSGFRLWLDIQVVEVNRDITTSSVYLFSTMQSDLTSLGFSSADDFDAAWGTSTLATGNFGGSSTLFGRTVGMAQWVTQDDFVAIHEVNHSIDSIYNTSDLAKYQFNHGIWAVPGGVGRDITVNAQILKNLLPVNFTALKAPFTKILTAPDADNDGIPDTSPAGLTNPLSITEATLGSSTASADTDGDGVSDLREATALPYDNSNLSAADTDSDGIPDSVDLNPGYRLNEHIRFGSPAINGTISTADGWTILTDHWGYSNTALVSDTNSLQGQTTTYAAWDQQYFYLALKGPSSSTHIQLDGSADNWFMGPDNYDLTLSNSSFSRAVKINVGVPDLFRQIDEDGQYSEFFDTDAQFTKPYNGRAFYNQSSEGAGFISRLVTESNLIYQRGGSGANSVFEVAIPWSNVTSFHGDVGKIMALQIDVGSDRLFSVDDAARVVLTVNSPPIANAGGPYAITEGGSLTLNASASTDADLLYGDALSYSWDVNGDGAFGDAAGVAPILTWQYLNALGITDNGQFNVRVRVNDSFGGQTVSAPSNLSVNNAPPTALVSGPHAATFGQALTLTLQANDPAPADQSAGFLFQIDWEGDGVFDQSIEGASGTTVDHTFGAPGDYLVRITATDKDSAVSPVATYSVSVVTAPVSIIGSDLYVTGGNDADNIYLGQVGVGTFFVNINNVSYGNWTLGPAGVVRVYSFAGNDQVTVGGTNGSDTYVLDTGSNSLNGVAIVGSEVEKWVYLGFSGDDTFTASGGSGAVIGSDGNDTFVGPPGDHRWNIHDNNLGDIDGIVWTFNGVENLTGGSGNDTFAFYGSAGLSGAVSGGVGINTLNYENVPSGVAVNLSIGLASNTGSIQNIQNVIGGPGNDWIIGDNQSNTLQGNDGADTIDGAGGDDFVLGGTWVYSAADGNDVLYAGAGADTELGGGGDDEMHGGDGADLITGGYWDLNSPGGNNTIVGDDGDDQIQAGNGSDTVSGGAGNDTILGAFWDFSGPDGDDKLAGDDGADMILGGKGSDTIDGGAGDDKLFGGNFAGPLAGDGNDIVIGRAGADLVDGGNGKDFLIGGQDIDNIYGEADDDLIVTGDVNIGASESAALAAILAEWTSADDYDTRVSKISGSATGANDPYFLDSSTVLADSAVDSVFGNDGLDWFVTDIADTIGDQNFPGPETRTDL